MRLSESWESSTPLLEEPSVGISPMDSTMHWDQLKFDRSLTGSELGIVSLGRGARQGAVEIAKQTPRDFYLWADDAWGNDCFEYIPSGDPELKEFYLPTPLKANTKWALYVYDSQSSDLKWYFMAMQSGGDEEIRTGAMGDVIDGINELIATRQFSVLSKLLESLDLSQVSTSVLLTFVRASFPIREYIDGWRAFVSSVSDEITRKGLDGEELLRGTI